MKIIIPTCDKFRNLLEANKYTVDKFGGANLDVTILGYKEPDFDLGAWNFVSLGIDTGAKNFSNNIKPFFDEFNEEYFIYGNDDGLLVNWFNHGFLNEIIETIKQIPNFGRMWLTRTPASYYGGGVVIKVFNEYNISEINQFAEYRLSLQCSIWKTSYFKKYLVPNLSPWEWETRGTAKYDNAAILLPVNNSVVSLGHIMKRGQLLKNWHQSIYHEAELSIDDIRIIEEIFKKHGIM